MTSNKPDMAETADYSEFCVLIVEDDEIMRISLEDRLRLEGVPVRSVNNMMAARQQIEKGDVDMVVTDISLPDGSGADLFNDISRHWPGTPVILMTAHVDVSKAVDLVKAGATDYLTKPFDIDVFIAKVLRNLSRIADIRISTEFIGNNTQTLPLGGGVLGKSPSMRRIERLVIRLNKVNSSVLITGESGVGKEVVATLIHRNSERASRPFITVNCAALPPNLVESELFGHEKGAFTGASHLHIGRFEQAQGGTIFLDEIAEIPPEIQVKLLRVLQQRTVERVGGGTPIKLDVRVIAATQVNLNDAISDGSFRPDLYWRLNVINIHIPPLRERRDDIVYLSRIFVESQTADMGISVKGLSREAEEHLLSMRFPGNVRELKNILERAVALCDGPRIMPHDLTPLEEGGNDYVTGSRLVTLKETVETVEKQVISVSLGHHDWAIGKAAKSLGISRKNLWEKMKRYGIRQA